MRGPVVALLAIVGGACATEPTATFKPEHVLHKIPIGDFNGYDPYPPGASGATNAYVHFAEDGLLRASLGCAVMGAPYAFSDNKRLIILHARGLSKPDYSNYDCSPDLIELEISLARFLENRPRIHPWSAEGLLLNKQGQSLLLQSVEDVLDEDIKMKVEL
ncbi:MAG: hypothetical protein NXH88_01995 [Hyphomonas sp.]|nr:hypothetical protein [Hyphomonas sp.]